MRNGEADIVGAILAGGQSRRFGVDKAQVRLGSATLLERAIDSLRPFDSSPLVIGRPPHLDERAGLGPLAGLETALRKLPTSANHLLLIAVDMPGINFELLQAIASAPNADVVVPYHDNRFHPLCSRWHRRVLPTITHILDRGERSMHSALDCLGVHSLTEEVLQRMGVSNPAHTLSNINDRDDLQRFIDRGGA